MQPGSPVSAIVATCDCGQRQDLLLLLEESGFRAIGCESGEAAIAILDRLSLQVRLLIAHHELVGDIDGAALSHWAKLNRPQLHVVVTTSSPSIALPDDAVLMPLPWLPLEVLKEAERARS